MTYSWGVGIGSPFCGDIASCALYSGGGGSDGPYDGGWGGWTPNPPKNEKVLLLNVKSCNFRCSFQYHWTIIMVF